MVAPPGAGPEGPERHPRDHPEADGDAGSRRRLGWVGLAVAGLGFVCGIMVSGLLAGSYAAARGLEREEADVDLGFALLSAAGVWVGFLLVPVLWAWRRRGAARELGLSARWADLPLGLAVGLASTAVTALVSAIALSRREQEELESIAHEQVDRASGAVAVVLLFLALCVFTPLAEEVFFRGLLLRSLRRLAGVVAALVGMGLVFGLLHYQFEPLPAKVVAVQLVLLSLFGIGLGVLAHRTGRLAASVVAHAVFNSVTVVSLLAQR